jgi:hypothetical protein
MVNPVYITQSDIKNANLTKTELFYYNAVNDNFQLSRKRLGEKIGKAPNTISTYYWAAMLKIQRAAIERKAIEDKRRLSLLTQAAILFV